MKAWIKLIGTKRNIEQAISELKSNIDYDNLEVEIIEGTKE